MAKELYDIAVTRDGLLIGTWPQLVLQEHGRDIEVADLRGDGQGPHIYNLRVHPGHYVRYENGAQMMGCPVWAGGDVDSAIKKFCSEHRGRLYRDRSEWEADVAEAATRAAEYREREKAQEEKREKMSDWDRRTEEMMDLYGS